MSKSKGFLLVLITALISGISIFLNTFAIKGFNPLIFTTLKNSIVVVFLISALLLLREFNELRKLEAKQWLQLLGVGLIGGSFAFLLFFYALANVNLASNAGFIHKTLFVWASLLAVVFLKEKVDKRFIAGALLLLIGNFFLFSSIGNFGLFEGLILLATVLWAAENVLAKKLLEKTNGRIVAFGRMFFGSAIMIGFLGFTNQLNGALELSFAQIQWVLLTSALLFLFVITYYSGLKYIPVHKATSILLLAQPITGILSFVFLAKEITFNNAIGFVLILAGVLTVLGAGYVMQLVNWKGFSLARKT